MCSRNSHLPHHHPVLEGKMSCTACHDPHKGSAIKSGGTELAGPNETCFQCHAVQRGPFVFEHEALRQGCITCHSAARLGQPEDADRTQRHPLSEVPLPAANRRRAHIVIGGRDHSGSMTRGTCWSAGCHEAVHGSQISSSLQILGGADVMKCFSQSCRRT